MHCWLNIKVTVDFKYSCIETEIMFWVSKQKNKIKMASKLPFNRISNQNGSKKSRFVFIFGIELSSQPLWRTRAEESEQNWTAWMFNGRHYVFGTLTMEWWAVNLGSSLSLSYLRMQKESFFMCNLVPEVKSSKKTTANAINPFKVASECSKYVNEVLLELSKQCKDNNKKKVPHQIK